jgi:hypothetical protein
MEGHFENPVVVISKHISDRSKFLSVLPGGQGKHYAMSLTTRFDCFFKFALCTLSRLSVQNVRLMRTGGF